MAELSSARGMTSEENSELKLPDLNISIFSPEIDDSLPIMVMGREKEHIIEGEREIEVPEPDEVEHQKMRFVPSDRSLFCALQDHVKGYKINPPDIIHILDIYKTDPWNLDDKFFEHGPKDDEAFFLTPRHAIATGLRAARIAGSGTWLGKGKRTDIYSRSKLIGYKTSLSFKPKSKSNNTQAGMQWIMHEYILHSMDENGRRRFQDKALCRMFKKRSGKRERKEEIEGDDRSKRDRKEAR